MNYNDFFETPIADKIIVFPTAPVTRGRFVDMDGNQVAVAGAPHFGVATDDFSAVDVTLKRGLTVFLLGIVTIEAGAAFARKAQITSDNQARGVTRTIGQSLNGWAIDAAAAAGDGARILLVRPFVFVAGAANADTAGATVGQLETEVNELKALLRSLGLMAP